MATENRPIITLLTDFGLDDHYVGSVKAAILKINEEARIIDITHTIDPQDIQEAAFVLQCAYQDYPQQTIHLVVVDPGVGTGRKPLLVTTESHYFIAPDNGVLSYIYKREECRVLTITASHYFTNPVSETFHARDIFAPVAAWLTTSWNPDNFGEELESYVNLELPTPKLHQGKLLKGTIMHVDRFGNLITNIHQKAIAKAQEQLSGKTPAVYVKEQTIPLVTTYENEEEATIQALFGSAGYLEVASQNASAATSLGLMKGDEVEIRFT